MKRISDILQKMFLGMGIGAFLATIILATMWHWEIPSAGVIFAAIFVAFVVSVATLTNNKVACSAVYLFISAIAALTLVVFAAVDVVPAVLITLTLVVFGALEAIIVYRCLRKTLSSDWWFVYAAVAIVFCASLIAKVMFF